VKARQVRLCNFDTCQSKQFVDGQLRPTVVKSAAYGSYDNLDGSESTHGVQDPAVTVVNAVDANAVNDCGEYSQRHGCVLVIEWPQT
jgi:hypothetical protein